VTVNTGRLDSGRQSFVGNARRGRASWIARALECLVWRVCSPARDARGVHQHLHLVLCLSPMDFCILRKFPKLLCCCAAGVPTDTFMEKGQLESAMSEVSHVEAWKVDSWQAMAEQRNTPLKFLKSADGFCRHSRTRGLAGLRPRDFGHRRGLAAGQVPGSIPGAGRHRDGEDRTQTFPRRRSISMRNSRLNNFKDVSCAAAAVYSALYASGFLLKLRDVCIGVPLLPTAKPAQPTNGRVESCRSFSQVLQNFTQLWRLKSAQVAKKPGAHGP